MNKLILRKRGAMPNILKLGMCLWFMLGIYSCVEKPDQDGAGMEPMRITDAGSYAEGPYFTSDHRGHPVLVWSEQINADDHNSGYVVRFIRFEADGQGIASSGWVEPSRGCSTTSESMNKIAFRQDGTMVAVYARRQPTEINRFAGALFYTLSRDGGKTWEEEKYLHVGDTTAGLSRSFFDLATLPDGEVGAVWLDSRLTQKRGDGSTLFFAKTEGHSGFLSDQPIDEGTCECCRTNLYVTRNGDIHVLYRSIWNDSIRDIAHVISKDLGKTFSAPARISPDNWVIYGCPHTGPSVAESEDGLNISWFTMGGNPGIYKTLFDPSSGTYDHKALLSSEGRHPQVIATGQQSVVHFWEENDGRSGPSHEMAGHGPVPSLSIRDFSEPHSVIKAQVWQRGEPVREHWVSSAKRFSSVPVAVPLINDYIGVAWLQKMDDGSMSVMYRRIKA